MSSSLPALMIERCAQAIEKVIIPNVTGDFASRQAMFIAAVLHTLAPTVEEKGKKLMKENEGMSETLGMVREVLRGEKALSSNAFRNKLIKTLDLKLQKGETKPPDIIEENHRLKGALVEIIKGLDALRNALPMKTMSSLKKQIRSVIRQQLDNDLERFVGFEVEKMVKMK